MHHIPRNKEEFLNALTHGLGTVLAVAALCAMLVYYGGGGVWHLTSCLVYGISLVLLYLASTLYHSFKAEKLKLRFKFLDHAAIYVLIAGNYTPFTLIPLHGAFGWTVFGIVWALAAAGIVFQAFFVRRFKVLSTICYLVMGWFAVVMIGPLMDALEPQAIGWMLAGGVFYTVGAVFYLLKRVPYNHAIWHLFVLAGSAAHFVAIAKFVLPLPVAAKSAALLLA